MYNKCCLRVKYVWNKYNYFINILTQPCKRKGILYFVHIVNSLYFFEMSLGAGNEWHTCASSTLSSSRTVPVSVDWRDWYSPQSLVYEVSLGLIHCMLLFNMYVKVVGEVIQQHRIKYHWWYPAFYLHSWMTK